MKSKYMEIPKQGKTKRKKTPRGKLAKKLELLAKSFVKLRDKYVCQKCGVTVEGSNCHASHVIPVSAGNQFKYDPVNLKVMCYHCHMNWWHKNPVEASEWFKEKFPDRYDYLFGKPRETVKFSVTDYEEMIEAIQLKINNLI